MPFFMYFELKFWFPLLGEPRKRKGFAISLRNNQRYLCANRYIFQLHLATYKE